MVVSILGDRVMLWSVCEGEAEGEGLAMNGWTVGWLQQEEWLEMLFWTLQQMM